MGARLSYNNGPSSSHVQCQRRCRSNGMLEMCFGAAATCIVSRRPFAAAQGRYDPDGDTGSASLATAAHGVLSLLTQPSADMAFLCLFILIYCFASYVSSRHSRDRLMMAIFTLVAATIGLVSFLTCPSRQVIVLCFIPRGISLSMIVSQFCHSLCDMLSPRTSI